ncbi:short chain dehydrogenase reductase [Xylariales sp. AK1849]|nr:short chain dehydrogenase reductase [Xylariales sp. AK1849]
MSQNTTKPTIALITGANQGIGRAIAIRLAKEHSFTVIIGSRNLSAGQVVADELQAAGCNAAALQLDLTSDASITAAVTTIADRFGRLDVLINNAAILLDEGGNVFAPRPKLPTRELFEQTFGTNVIGTACLTEALLPLLHKATQPPGPRVIFVSSRMGAFSCATDRTTPTWPVDYRAYDASKAALNMLTVNYARILEKLGGTANAVCPGLVSTNMIDHSPAGAAPEVGAQRVVDLATGIENGPNGTFSDRDGPLGW